MVSVYETLKDWVGRGLSYANWDRDVEVVEHDTTKDGESVRIRIYTETNSYSISACLAPGKSYLGCIASSRKPRAGEDWTRGNDLPDGEFWEETWRKILAAIVGYELVKIHRESKAKADEPVAAGAQVG